MQYDLNQGFYMWVHIYIYNSPIYLPVTAKQSHTAFNTHMITYVNFHSADVHASVRILIQEGLGLLNKPLLPPQINYWSER